MMEVVAVSMMAVVMAVVTMVMVERVTAPRRCTGLMELMRAVKVSMVFIVMEMLSPSIPKMWPGASGPCPVHPEVPEHYALNSLLQAKLNSSSRQVSSLGGCSLQEDRGRGSRQHVCLAATLIRPRPPASERTVLSTGSSKL